MLVAKKHYTLATKVLLMDIMLPYDCIDIAYILYVNMLTTFCIQTIHLTVLLGQL